MIAKERRIVTRLGYSQDVFLINARSNRVAATLLAILTCFGFVGAGRTRQTRRTTLIGVNDKLMRLQTTIIHVRGK